MAITKVMERLRNSRVLAVLFFVFIVISYFVTGVLGLELSIPPSYATAVFPASGIALGSLLVLGWRYFPAVFMGSALVNYYSASLHGGFGSRTDLIVFLVASGAALQALVGRYLIQKFVPRFKELSDEKSIFLFFILAGPFSCLVSATVSVSALSFFDILSGPGFFYNWMMWYVGDAIGSMVFAPIVLALAAKKSPRASFGKPVSVVPSLVMFGFVVGFFIFSSHQMSEKSLNVMKTDSEINARSIIEALKKYEVVLASTERFFSSSEEISRAEFQKFLREYLQDNSGIRAISWNPQISHEQRAQFEARGVREGIANFKIKEFKDGEFKVSAQRGRYFPVFYTEPMEGNSIALGYDTYSSPARRLAINQAIEKKTSTISSKLQVVQDPKNSKIPSIAMYYPVFEKNGPEVHGLIVGLFKVQDLIDSAVDKDQLAGLNYLVYDVTDTDAGKVGLYEHFESPEEKALYQNTDRNPSLHDQIISKEFEIGGRKWLFEILPSQKYISENADLAAWSMLLGGLLFVILLQSLMMVILGRTAIVQKLVDEKTEELSIAYLELEKLNKIISEDLKASDFNFKQLAESMPQIVWVLDANGQRTYINHHWKDYTGYGPEDINWEEVLHPDDVEKTKNAWKESFEAEKTYEVQYRIKSKEGEYRWFLIKGVAIRDPENRSLKWFGACTDIHEQVIGEQKRTELEIREKSAIEASKLKSIFLANMSHEIRTPINGVVGMVGLLLGTNLTKEQREFAENVENSAKSLLHIVNDVLDFSKVEAGKLDLEIIDFNLEQTVQDTFKSFQFFAREKKILLLIDLSEAPACMLRGDPSRLRQVLTNLLNNAIKFTDTGKVVLRIRKVSEDPLKSRMSFRFEVEDSGIGIAESALKKIFQPFDQADTSTTRRFGGTGLGLSISKQLVELMNGQIGVQSTLGTGSLFWFEVEFEQGAQKLNAGKDAKSQGAQDPNRVQVQAPGLRVLLAEDNRINQLIASKQLESIGCHCDVVANGQEAIEALKSVPYDLVLMDCQMPEMDGYEATERIRSLKSAFSAIPIIAMTANAMKGDREKCLQAGMNDYVTKPISISDLSVVIQRWGSVSS